MSLPQRMIAARQRVEDHFEYRPDPGIVDDWRVSSAQNGTIKGDCEDFSLAVLWEYSEQSWIKFWFLIVTFQAVMWHVKSYNGNGHAVMWFRGHWCDNMAHDWYEGDEFRHKLRFPYLFPLMMLKLLLAKIQRMFF